MRKTIKIRCITNGMVYNSAREAAEDLGLHRSNITACFLVIARGHAK